MQQRTIGLSNCEIVDFPKNNKGVFDVVPSRLLGRSREKSKKTIFRGGWLPFHVTQKHTTIERPHNPILAETVRSSSLDGYHLKLRATNKYHQEGRLSRTRSDSHATSRAEFSHPRVMIPETPHGKIHRSDSRESYDELELVDSNFCEEGVAHARQLGHHCYHSPIEGSQWCASRHSRHSYLQSCCCSATYEHSRHCCSQRRCSCENCYFDENVVSCQRSRWCEREQSRRRQQADIHRTTRVVMGPKDRSPSAPSLRLRTPLKPLRSSPIPARRPSAPPVIQAECVVGITPTKGIEFSQFTQSATPVPSPRSITKVCSCTLSTVVFVLVLC